MVTTRRGKTPANHPQEHLETESETSRSSTARPTIGQTSQDDTAREAPGETLRQEMEAGQDQTQPDPGPSGQPQETETSAEQRQGGPSESASRPPVIQRGVPDVTQLMIQMAAKMESLEGMIKRQGDIIERQSAIIDRYGATNTADDLSRLREQQGSQLPRPPTSSHIDETENRPQQDSTTRRPSITTDPDPVLPPRDNPPLNTFGSRPDTGMASRSIGGHTTASSTTTKISYRKPPTYDGTDDPKFWLLEIEQDLAGEPEHFISDRTKVEYASRYLEDKSAIKRRFQILMLQTHPEPATYSWSAFREWCLEGYGATDPVTSAEFGMKGLRYRSGTSIRDFINECETLLADLRWNDDAVKATF
ncbi:MAG: hypothetical protein M1823_006301 [Watsoniomyces obsoletus]|nr:MAG: hypothetical protein M1823_006301 [Watsoniomyces obsoletus]